MNKISILSIIKPVIFMAAGLFFIMSLQSCKKYDPDKTYTVEFVKQKLAKQTGLDTLYVKFSEGYDGKGSLFFKSLDNAAIEVAYTGPDFVIINKKSLVSSSAAIVVTLLNEAKINSADTIGFGNLKYQNKIIYEKPVGFYKDLIILDPVTLAQTNMTNTPTIDESFPTLSADGNYYAYVTEGTFADTIHIINSEDFSAYTKAITGSISSLKFSGDGNYLCYVVNQRPKGMDLNGNDLNLTFKTNSSGYVTGAHFTYSNGMFITSTTYNTYNYYYGYSYNVSINNEDVYTGPYYNTNYPCLNANGSKVMFVTESSGGGYNTLMDDTPGNYSSSTLVSSSYYSYVSQPDYNSNAQSYVFTARPSSSNNNNDLYIFVPNMYYYTNITNTPSINETNPNWN